MAPGFLARCRCWSQRATILAPVLLTLPQSASRIADVNILRLETIACGGRKPVSVQLRPCSIADSLFALRGPHLGHAPTAIERPSRCSFARGWDLATLEPWAHWDSSGKHAVSPMSGAGSSHVGENAICEFIDMRAWISGGILAASSPTLRYVPDGLIMGPDLGPARFLIATAHDDLGSEPSAQIVLGWERNPGHRLQHRALAGRLVTAYDDLRKLQNGTAVVGTNLVDSTKKRSVALILEMVRIEHPDFCGLCLRLLGIFLLALVLIVKLSRVGRRWDCVRIAS